MVTDIFSEVMELASWLYRETSSALEAVLSGMGALAGVTAVFVLVAQPETSPARTVRTMGEKVRKLSVDVSINTNNSI